MANVQTVSWCHMHKGDTFVKNITIYTCTLVRRTPRKNC